MNKYILNEKEYVEDFIREQKLEDISNLNYMIRLLVRYYIQLGVVKKEVIDLILSKTKDLENLNLQEFELNKKIKDIVNKEFKLNIKLKEFDYIPLYESELNKIKTCKNDKERKFLFTCYILAYFYKNEWINISYTDLFKLANISLSGDSRLLFIGEMIEKGFIDIAKKNTNLSLKIMMDKQGGEVFKINEIKNLGNQFLAFNKPNIKLCQGIKVDKKTNKEYVCNKPIKIKNKNDYSTKYCEECSKEELKKQKLKWWNENNRK